MPCFRVRGQRQIAQTARDAEAISAAEEAMVRQEHAPGAEAEVDFGELWVMLAGVKTKCFMFAYRLSYATGTELQTTRLGMLKLWLTPGLL